LQNLVAAGFSLRRINNIRKVESREVLGICRARFSDWGARLPKRSGGQGLP